MPECPNPEGTLLRLNLGETEIDLLGLTITLPNGLCLLLSAEDLEGLDEDTLAKIKKGIDNGRLKISGTLINDGKSKSIIKVRKAVSTALKRKRISKSGRRRRRSA